ncbi:hypothetical protein NQT62_06730 [Limnobacter humi]|uniref:DUF962 domain-containing protein n=1 Tax=Limnobacter humi TaxID=1778671 RepID=A0ABT1WF53_9BURK|nr:hypothetical protein [Limnobacter humi]MCQ8896131.1 hypothetical protein [Limnobacter humi]
MKSILNTLQEQRWDDHRYYHHSRINQSLHLLSALSFLFGYVLLFVDPIAAAFVAWLVAMTSRQIGHFFFEPKSYDEVNQATHDYKEDIKVGYNLRRKIILLSIWVALPAFIWFTPSTFGLPPTQPDIQSFVHTVGECWLYLGFAGLVFRTLHLFFIRDVETGLVWALKIMTDPFHDVKLYYKSPFYLLKGQLIDPMDDVKARQLSSSTRR